MKINSTTVDPLMFFSNFFFLNKKRCFLNGLVLCPVKTGILSLISAVLLAFLILLVVGVAVIWAQRKKQNNKPTKQKGKKIPVVLTHVAQTAFLHFF